MALLGCDVVTTDQVEVLPLLMRNVERNTSRILQMNSDSGVLCNLEAFSLPYACYSFSMSYCLPLFTHMLPGSANFVQSCYIEFDYILYLECSSDNNGGVITLTTSRIVWLSVEECRTILGS